MSHRTCRGCVHVLTVTVAHFSASVLAMGQLSNIGDLSLAFVTGAVPTTHHHQICFVRLRVHMGECRVLLVRDVLREHAPHHDVCHTPQPLLCRLTVDVVREDHLVSKLARERHFDAMPSATPVVRTCSSASAELNLTDCCVLDHAESVAFPHCTIPSLLLLLL